MSAGAQLQPTVIEAKMTNPPPINAERELAKLALAQMQDVLLARFIGREEATRMGFPPLVLTRIATAISEMARNVIQHSTAQGLIVFSDLSQAGRRGLKIVVQDSGSGIERLDDMLLERNQALGAGIPGTRRLMDEFEIESKRGAGTKVTMTKWLS